MEAEELIAAWRPLFHETNEEFSDEEKKNIKEEQNGKCVMCLKSLTASEGIRFVRVDKQKTKRSGIAVCGVCYWKILKKLPEDKTETPHSPTDALILDG